MHGGPDDDDDAIWRRIGACCRVHSPLFDTSSTDDCNSNNSIAMPEFFQYLLCVCSCVTEHLGTLVCRHNARALLSRYIIKMPTLWILDNGLVTISHLSFLSRDLLLIYFS